MQINAKPRICALWRLYIVATSRFSFDTGFSVSFDTGISLEKFFFRVLLLIRAPYLLAHNVYTIRAVVAIEGWGRVNRVVILLYCIVSMFTTWGQRERKILFGMPPTKVRDAPIP